MDTEDDQPGLNMETALLVRTPRIVLNTFNLQKEYFRVDRERGLPKNDCFKQPLPGLDIHLWEKEVAELAQSCPLDVALCIVLCQKGLTYHKTGDTARPPVAPPLIPTSTEAETSNQSDAERPTPVNASSNETGGAEAESDDKPQAPPVERKKSRLQPNEHADGDPRIQDRFCWNVGYWLEDRVGKTSKYDYITPERFAAGLFTIPDTNDGLSESETVDLRSIEWLPVGLYRNLRARILIGLACIHEHNIRGSKLNTNNQLHIACRPDQDKPFKFINMGKSQAQLVTYGFDVSKASKIHQICTNSGRIPDFKNLPKSTIKTRYQRLPDLDTCFPERRRRELYKDLLDWYEETVVYQELRFIIASDYSEPSRYNITPDSSDGEPRAQ